MKNLVLFLAFLWCSILSVGQNLPGQYKIGKDLHLHKYFSPEKQSSLIGTEINTLPSAVTYAPKNRQTHSVTFHFVPANLIFDLILESTDTAIGNLMLNGSALTLEDGYYDLIAHPWIGSEEVEYLIMDRLHVYKDMDTTITLSSAIYGVKLKIQDKNGPVTPSGWSPGNGIGMIVELTPGVKFTNWSTTGSGTRADSIRCTPIPSSMKVRFGREVLLHNEHYISYVINYPVIQNLTGDTVLTNDPQELQEFQHIFNATPGGNDYFFCWGYGTVSNSSMTGYIDTFVMSSAENSCPSKANDTAVLILNHGINDTTLAFFASFIDHVEYDPATGPVFISLMSPIVYLDTNDDLILSVQGNYPPVDGDYHVPAGEAAHFGISPPFNVTWSYSPPQSNQITVSTHYRGPANERRYIDFTKSTYQVWKNNQMLVYDSLRDFHLNLGVPSSGEYQLIFNDSNYRIGGMQGFQQTILDFDLSDPVDPNAPTPLSFSVKQGGLITQEIIRGYEASVEFTAGDLEIIPGSLYRLYHTLYQVNFFYKEHFTDTWLPLNVTALTNDLDSLCGMPYYADLAPVMNAVSDSAWIDLRMELIDSAGNMCIQTFNPAFLLRDVIAGINTEKNNDLECFPDPVRTLLYFKHPEKLKTVTICTAEGKEILTLQEPVSINFSSFTPGIYLLRARGTDGSVFIKKILKI